MRTLREGKHEDGSRGLTFDSRKPLRGARESDHGFGPPDRSGDVGGDDVDVPEAE